MQKLTPEASAPVFDTPLTRQSQTRNKAAELFARQGFGQVSMRELAAHLGIRPGSLYNHFESKESLLFELIEELYETLLATAEGQQGRHQQAVSQWHAMLRAHLSLHESKGVYFWVAEHEYRSLSQPHQTQIQRLRQSYEEHLLTLLVDAGASSSSLLRTAVQGIVSLLNTLPALFEHAPLSTAERLSFIAEVAYGSVAGALKAARHPGLENLLEPGSTQLSSKFTSTHFEPQGHIQTREDNSGTCCGG